MSAYYVVKEGARYVLRQVRFKDQLASGREHPHDVCAYAHSVEDMKGMVAKYFTGEVDYSAVESS